ncbi:MAG TPA: type II secretion system protein [Solirubrobacterales bacterium]|nr:type II secretion system protein [Solirubrobacterales bacterium]
MMRLLRARLGTGSGEAGLTMIELIVASMMSVVLVGAAMSMVISSVRSQPEISKRAQSISTARWVMERMTREIRNGIGVDVATASKVSFLGYVRHSTCGSSGALASGTPAIKCQITYQCTTTSCSRIEAPDGVMTGTAVTLFSGIDSADVFCYVPSKNEDALSCGEALSTAGTTYIGLNLHIPNPNGAGAGLTVSDGASMRNSILAK